MDQERGETVFSPILVIGKGTTDISFYTNAFGAIERRRFSNEDGSIHVAELSVDGVIFRVQEENSSAGRLSVASSGGVTTTIGLRVTDPDGLMARAIRAGAIELSAIQDYDYGYRQGKIADPFGHHWLLEKAIEVK